MSYIILLMKYCLILGLKRAVISINFAYKCYHIFKFAANVNRYGY